MDDEPKLTPKEQQMRGIRDFKRTFSISDSLLGGYLKLAGWKQEDIQATLAEPVGAERARPDPAKHSLLTLWNADAHLNRILVILQSVFIMLFTYRQQEVIFSIFSIWAFICFFAVPVVYIMKLSKGRALNRKIRVLVAEGKVPAWIPKRRSLVFLSWLIVANPAFWIFFVVMLAGISQVLPIALTLVFMIPWFLLELLHKREAQYLAPYLQTGIRGQGEVCSTTR